MISEALWALNWGAGLRETKLADPRESIKTHPVAMEEKEFVNH